MAKKKGALRRYKSYMFTNKDPIIDALHTAFQDSGENYTSLSASSGVSPTTFSNWFNGNVRRPQFPTVAATARALGKSVIRFDSKGRPYLED